MKAPPQAQPTGRPTVAASARPSRRARRFAVRTGRMLLLVVLLLVATTALISQSGVLKWLVLPALEHSLGCNAESGRIVLTWDGTVLITHLRLSAKDVDSPEAARFLEAPHVEVAPRTWGLLGRMPIQSITLRRPTIRLSQNQNGRLNVAGLGRGGPSAALPDFMPRIELIDATLDLGEHGPGWYTSLLLLRVEGDVLQPDRSQPRYTVELAEYPSAMALPPMLLTSGDRIRVSGQFDLASRSCEVALDHIDLSRWRDQPVPSRYADLWRQMRVSGNISQALFSFDEKSGPVASFRLSDVSMGIPLKAEALDELMGPTSVGPPRPADEPIQMRRVSGNMRFTNAGFSAELDGEIEDLPCRVELTMSDYNFAAPLRCTIRAPEFRVSERPRLLPFAPFYVKRNFERFSGPTALVSGVIEIERRAPQGPDAGPDGEASAAQPLRVQGQFDFKDGSAAFEKFRYPFSKMQGTIRFDETAVDIVSISGIGPTGAKMFATGRVEPPRDGGSVTVDVTVVDTPTDEHLIAAVPEKRRPLLDLILSEDELAKLGQEGLLAVEGAAPFKFGGLADIRVQIHRPLGDHATYNTKISVKMREAGVISSVFPYPVMAENLSLRISDDEVVVDAPVLKGLHGGEASLHADVVLSQARRGDSYGVVASAKRLPIDDLLLRALPRQRDAGAAASPSPRDLARKLDVKGAIDADASLASGDDGALLYDVAIHLDGLSAAPAPGCIDLSVFQGSLTASNDGLRCEGLTGTLGSAVFDAEIAATEAPKGGIRAKVSALGFDLSDPVEDLLAIVAPAYEDQLRSFRTSHAPDGAANATLAFSTEVGGEPGFSLELTPIAPASFAALGSRIELREPVGSVSIGPEAVVLHAFQADAVLHGQSFGRISLDGSWPIAPNGKGELSVSAPSARLESELARSVLQRLSPSIAAIATDHRARFMFGLSGVARPSVDGSISFEGVVEPTSLVVTRNETEVAFDRFSGRIVFGDSGGRIENLRAEADGWSLRADGVWSGSPWPSATIDLELESDGLPAQIRALLPEEARQAIDSASLVIAGDLRTSRGRIEFSGEEGAHLLRISAAASFDEAMAFVPTAVELRDGRFEIDLAWPMDSQAPPSLSAMIASEVMIIKGLPLSHARSRIVSGDRPGEYIITEIKAGAMGGTIVGNALLAPAVKPAAGAGGTGRSYTLELQGSGIGVSALLTSLKAVSQSEPIDPAVALADPAPDRGRAEASLSLAGIFGKPDSRRGRGVVRVEGGEVVALPGMMPMLRLSNLQPPIGEKLGLATAIFHVRGPVVTFESIRASSESLTIEGSGDMRLPSTELAIRLNSRGNGTIPLIDDLLRGVRNEMITTVVSGTLDAVEYRTESFPATQRMLGSIFRESPARVPAVADAPIENAP